VSKKDLKTIGTVAAVGAAVVAIHGITSKRWQTAHTVFTVVGALVAVSTFS
jgi:hypothetical protein